MDKKKEISIIIPIYNGENFIRKSYDFVLSQNIENIEILYVDNNSKDNSIAEIKKIQGFDKRVVLLQQSIQGAAAARNKGLEHAQGEYIYMFDVDDQIYPEALISMKQVLDAHPEVEAVFGKEAKSHRDILETKKPEKETNEVVFKDKPYWGIKWFSDLKSVLGPPAFLYRRNVFDKIGFYEINIPASEDTAMDIKLGMLCKIAFIDKYVFLYFKHGSSTTDIIKRKTDRSFMQWPRFTKSHLPFYLNHSVPMEFKEILFRTIFASMGRMINLTQGLKARKSLKNQLFDDIESIKTPWFLKKYLAVMVFFNFTYVYKFYIYYLLPKLLPSLIKINDEQLNR